MTRRYATRELVLTYLRTVKEPRNLIAITRYMRKMHRVEAGATRTAIWRLAKLGEVRRVGRGEYQIGMPAEALDTTPPALTTH